jgi:hypothetical protein
MPSIARIPCRIAVSPGRFLATRSTVPIALATVILVAAAGPNDVAGAETASGPVPAPVSVAASASIDRFFSAPAELANDYGSFRSPLKFGDGRDARTAEQWAERRKELEAFWHGALGGWPALLPRPQFTILRSEDHAEFVQHRVRWEIAAGRFEEGWFLVPRDGTRRVPGSFPAVLVPFYEPETSIGLKGERRDFALQLTRRGFVTLSIGSPGGDARKPEPKPANPSSPAATAPAIATPWQPLSFLAYVAANAHTALAQRPEVDPARIGIVGHSYGGKWALFAGALYDKFACVVVSDPGIVWDEARPNVNYWEPWYLGRDSLQTRKPGLIAAGNPRTGAYRQLVETGHDLTEIHALLAPRPFLVSGGAEDPPTRWRALNHLVAVNRVLGVSNRVAMTNRATHDPTAESNEHLCAFFERFLKPNSTGAPSSRP